MAESGWTFLTSHGLVLVALAREPGLRLREVADLVGITERAVQDLVNDMVQAGYLERRREGRRNRYVVHGEAPLPHPLTRDRSAADLFGGMISEFRLPPRTGECEAVVIACSDYRFQEGLRQFLAAQGLLGRAEVVLRPGGGAALAGSRRGEVLSELAALTVERKPSRLLLIAHQDCTAPEIFRRRRDDARTYRALVRERRLALARVERRVGLAPEPWFMDRRRTRRLTIHDASREEVPRAR